MKHGVVVGVSDRQKNISTSAARDLGHLLWHQNGKVCPELATSHLKPNCDNEKREQLYRARYALHDQWPHLSAVQPVSFSQVLFVALLSLLAFVAIVASQFAATTYLYAILILAFFLIVVLRSIAFLGVYKPANVSPLPVSEDDCTTISRFKNWFENADQFPVYTILLPVYDDPHVVGQLLKAIDALHYPKEKLDVLLILEQDDEQTHQALRAKSLQPYVRVVNVPEDQLRTKPKALNYAMFEARGEFVVVYDAEDIPDADQLLKSLAMFSTSDADVGCLQARLQTYNPNESWFSRQFTIEYTALFDALLPALEQLNLPLPLGGTSNHFRRDVLDAVGGWDPHNVTEDADLGIRMLRFGWRVRVLDSTTWEEAPHTFSIWRRQRTRWLKGWMQTFLVHMHSPRLLVRELGVWRSLGFFVLMGGLLLSAVVHPWLYIVLLFQMGSQSLSSVMAEIATDQLLMLGVGTLVLGYLSAMVLGAIVVKRRRRAWLAGSVISMPVYWLLISVAAYCALWQFMCTPFYWEKTPHRGRLYASSSASEEM